MDDRVLGTFLLIGSLTALAVYGALILAIFAWIGNTLVTTQTPTPLEDSFEDSTTLEG